MKIILNFYKHINFGNNKYETLIITTNKIPVSFLKNIISQQYDLDKSSISLSVKMYNLFFVIMVDNFPIYFYNIKENSVIYVEIFENTKSIEESVKKIKIREGKSEYLRKLNIFRKNKRMDVIKESTLEDIEIENENSLNDSIIKIDDENISENNIILEEQNNVDELSKIIEKRFINAIINNKIEEFRDIMKQYKNLIDINKPIGKSGKYSPVHFASMFGYAEMMKDLISKYSANINLISKDGWSPLHLCSYNGTINILNIFIQIKKVKFNMILPKLGTPLHCACKQNNLKIVSLLLYKENPEIKNDEGLLPIELTNNKNIKKLINKVIKGQNYYQNENLDISMNNKNQLDKFQFLKELESIPVCPPRYVGFCYKRGKRFSIYNPRFIEINANKNLFLRFMFKEDYPNKVKEVLILSDIKSCRIMPYSESDSFFYIEIKMYDLSQIFKFESLKLCNIWTEKINQSIEYSKHWKKMAKKYLDVPLYLSSIKPEVYEIDYFSGDIQKFEMKKNITPINNISLNHENNLQTKNNNSNKENKILNLLEFKELIYTCNVFKIYKVENKLDGNNLLMKIFHKKNLAKRKLLKTFNSQLSMQKQLNSHFFPSIYHSLDINDDLYLVLDYCPYNNLSFYKNKIIFEEDSIKLYIAEIIVVIEYIHKLEYVFKNLSLENILITKDNHIKLTDLELNKNFNNSINNYDDGTRKGTGISADIYCLGSILYELVSGIPPLFITNISFKTKKKEEELFLFNFFSDNLKDLLSKLLCKNPNQRIGIKSKKEIKAHPWFKNINWDNLLIKYIKPPINFSLIKEEIDKSLNNC